jgi:three-Cys-motif partner protein
MSIDKEKKESIKRQGKYKDFIERLNKLKNYVSVMYDFAKQLIEALKGNKITLNQYIKEYYGRLKEHYWTAKKLLILALYLPMFLQIGRKHFDAVIYVDTHAGPGLAVIGAEEWFLGSPLIAAIWPSIVAKKYSQFKKIAVGFDRMYFVDIDNYAYATLLKLKEIVTEMHEYQNLKDKIVIRKGDANTLLCTEIKENIQQSYKGKKILVLMFIDPFGSFDNQIKYSILDCFTKDLRVDIIMVTLFSELARGFASDTPLDIIMKRVEMLWGKDFCSLNEAKELSICKCFDQKLNPKQCDIDSEDITEAYENILRIRLGYRKVIKVPVQGKDNRVYYYIIIATKGKGEWLERYVEYINKYIPSDYNELKMILTKSIKQDTMKLLDDHKKKAKTIIEYFKNVSKNLSAQNGAKT